MDTTRTFNFCFGVDVQLEPVPEGHPVSALGFRVGRYGASDFIGRHDDQALVPFFGREPRDARPREETNGAWRVFFSFFFLFFFFFNSLAQSESTFLAFWFSYFGPFSVMTSKG